MVYNKFYRPIMYVIAVTSLTLSMALAEPMPAKARAYECHTHDQWASGDLYYWGTTCTNPQGQVYFYKTCLKDNKTGEVDCKVHIPKRED